LILSSSVFAKDRIYLTKDEAYVSLAGDNNIDVPTDDAMKEFASKGSELYWVASSSLRSKYLKALAISESDSLYIKKFGIDKTEVHPISKLKFVIDMNPAGDTHIGSYGFAVSLDRGAIAAIGNENPFKDVAFKKIPSLKGIYQLGGMKILNLKKDGRSFDMADAETDLTGSFEFVLQNATKRDLLFSEDIRKSAYLISIDVYAGEVLKDGSTLIFFRQNDCGDFVKIKDSKIEKWPSLCGSWGC
jgi:hypothetical protein